MDSVVVVKIDNKKKSTSLKKNTDSPYYNEYFVFELHTTFDKIIDKHITITVIQPRNVWRKRKTLGYVMLDVATVWQQKNHQFYHKWAILSAHKTDTFTGPRGYIKLDISVLAKGEVPRIPVHIVNDEIEGNLLLPEGIFTERQKAKYIFDVHRCSNIVKKPSNVVKDHGVESSKSSEPTTFVEIMFAGISVRTSTKKHTCFPEFNERLTIIDFFPPLCQRIRIELCHGESMKKKVHSYKYISLKLISNDKDEGFLPTFGPSMWHFYTSNMLEGYAGSIIMSMNTEIEKIVVADPKKKTAVETILPLNERLYFNYEGVTLFSCIFEITAINKKYSNEPVSIRMSFGRSTEQNKLLPSGDNILTNSTDPKKPKKIGKKYFHIEITDEKPCMWITDEVPFFKKRVYNSNILIRITRDLDLRLKYIEALFESHNLKQLSEEIDEKLLDAIDYLNVAGRKYIDIVSAYTVDYNTKLDRERRNMCLREMLDITQDTQNIYQKTSKKRTFRKLQKHYRRIQALVDDAQDCWPDICLWMILGKKKVVCYRIPARDIVYSPIVEERGQYCGIKRTLCFYANERDQKNLACKLDILLFLCLDRHKSEFINEIPVGFAFKKEIESLPRELVAETRYVFQLRAYIFQGKVSSGFDKSGLADPFVRIVTHNQVKDTQVIYNCLNPIWDQTLIFENIPLYGSKSNMREILPTILVEVYDQDEFNNIELIGRAIVEPDIIMDEDDYRPPILKWTELYLNEEVGAEVLAAFELLEVTEGNHISPLQSPRKHIFDIPPDIKPDLTPHKMEVLFWGMRDLGKVNLLSVNRPRLTVLCGDPYLNSDTIENAVKNPNFPNPAKSLDVILPKQQNYAPPLRFKMYDSRRFGMYVFAGVHITSIESFLVHPMTRREREMKLSGFGYKSFDSMASKSSSSLKIQLRNNQDSDSETESVDIRKKDRSCFLMRCLKKCCKSKRTRESSGKSAATLGTYEPLPQQDDGNEDDYDWWTKFYASHELITAAEENSSENKVLRLQIYGNELENQPEFKGFTDILMSFPLYKGKRTGDDMIDDENVNAVFKGSVKIYEQPDDDDDDDEEYLTDSGWSLEEGIFKSFPENVQLRYLLRVYCVRAIGLMPKDLNGKSDPYLYLTLNDKVISDKGHVVMRQVSPVFGRCFEFNAMFPYDHTLKVAVWDYDLATSDDLIGETKIDLEVRYYTKHRAQCGIAQDYRENGYCAWREHQKPTSILADLCRKWNTEPPEYGPTWVRVGFKEFSPENFISSDNSKIDKEVLALNALHRWKEMPVVGFTLVPEYVETRSLFDPAKPGIEQGKLQLWIDIFPVSDLPPPKMVDITPRRPGRYELRVIIWNTEEVVLDEDDFFTGERKSDIYVKGWLTNSSEAQYTDVHYRSLTGEGNFNWRFVFPFEYLPTENKLVVRRKETVFALDETEFKMPCVLTMQVWDNDTFSKDDFLGTLSLELSKMYRPARTVKKCKLSIIEKGAPTINLFKIRRTRGWWPFRNIDPKRKEYICTGKVEAELEIVFMEEAIKEPVGKGRHEPQALPLPNRPNTSFLWFKNPFIAVKHVICKLYRWKIIKCMIGVVLIFFVVAGFYAFPGYSVKKFLGV